MTSDPTSKPMTQSLETLSERMKGVSLYLVGMMGAGKSTVGRILAKQLSYRFCDTDAIAEQVAGKPITAIFAESGEAAFRALETQVLAEVAAYRRMAIATGGGIVMEPMNWSYLRHGLVVWLDVPTEILYARLKGNTTRPLLQHPNPQQRLEELLEQRRSHYSLADLQICVCPDESPQQVAERVLQGIAGILKPEVLPPEPGSFELRVDPSASLPINLIADADRN